MPLSTAKRHWLLQSSTKLGDINKSCICLKNTFLSSVNGLLAHVHVFD